jgi:pimeloyl-ACP methyl ester carboxylesterase
MDYRPGGIMRSYQLIALLVVTSCNLSGCVSLDVNTARGVATVMAKFTPNRVEMRKRAENPLTATLNLMQWSGPEPTEQVKLFLRRFDLLEIYHQSPEEALAKLHYANTQQPALDTTYAIAELAYIQGEFRHNKKQTDLAEQWFVGAIGHAHQYLFDPQLARGRNPYSPEFRRVCEIYNQSLEGLLRIAKANGNLKNGAELSVSTCGTQVDFQIKLTGRWEGEQFEKFEFVSDYKTPAIANNYHNYGLGVPLIAVLNSEKATSDAGQANMSRRAPTPHQKYYPPGLSLPLTAFFRWTAVHDIPAYHGVRYRATIELLDPLEVSTVNVSGNEVPIESNITTPLVYFLDDPLLQTDAFALFAMIDGDFAQQFEGLYMLEPFDPDKIPVVMVHGLASSPITWLEMFNDLRADRAIRDRYQFWFYLYPSGQPFWHSAGQMRQELAELQKHFDPNHENWALNQMVLVGHSMGGLVSTLQTLDSGEEFWHVLSDQPFERLQGSEEEKQELAKQVYFSPNRSINRVITIATPHRGSDFANSTTKWLSHRFFKTPDRIFKSTPDLLKRNKELIRDPEFLAIHTSVDSLSPESPIFPAMQNAQRAPWVHYHNIIGRVPNTGALAWIMPDKSKQGDGDGVVSAESASLPNVDSQIEVAASHTDVHRLAPTIQEVRRILLVHVTESDAQRQFSLQESPHGTIDLNRFGEEGVIPLGVDGMIQQSGFTGSIGDQTDSIQRQPHQIPSNLNRN